MPGKLEKATKQWMALERKTLEQRKAADQFYDENVMKLIEEDYIRRNSEEVQEAVENLIVSVGTSYEPIVLNISMLKPARILFLYTEKSESILEKVVKYCNLSVGAYEKSRINERFVLWCLMWMFPKRSFYKRISLRICFGNTFPRRCRLQQISRRSWTIWV